MKALLFAILFCAFVAGGFCSLSAQEPAGPDAPAQEPAAPSLEPEEPAKSEVKSQEPAKKTGKMKKKGHKKEAGSDAEGAGEKTEAKRIKAVGESGKKIEAIRDQARTEDEGGFDYAGWKENLDFWPWKAVLLVELSLLIIIGVLLGQILEVSGLIRYLAILTWPITFIGRLSKDSGPPLIMAFQSGAVANTMLVNYRDQGLLNRRELYTSVLVVSCISLFAHVPTFIPVFFVAFGQDATLAYFGTRFAAIFVEIFFILLASNLISRHKAVLADASAGVPSPIPALPETAPAPKAVKSGGMATEKPDRPWRASFWAKVFGRSKRTLYRLLLYVLPTFLVVSLLEYYEAFDWLAEKMSGFFDISGLPIESVAIVPAQAGSLYSGAIVAANFLDTGALSIRTAILVLLVGTLLTAPVRTLKHALPTYIAVLGPRTGTVLAISAQVLRSIFLIIGILILAQIWRP